jgi:DDE superfamily endonuclease
MPLPEAILTVVAPFRPLFTAPTWRKLMTLLTGTLLARGRRTVCSALRLSGEADNEHWSSFHQVLNRARWSPLAASCVLLFLIVETLLPTDAIIEIAIDETLERRWGPQISKRGHYRDSALSSRKHSVSSPGLRWIVMTVVVPVPWSKQPWALPFLAVLATTPGVSKQLGLRHHTVGERARQMIRLVHRWLPDRQVCVLGDTAYSCLEVGVQAHHCGVILITPAQLDSVLHAPPPLPEQRRRGGKPQIVGVRLPSLEAVLSDADTIWQQSQMPWYGQGLRTIEWCSGTALWYRFGHPPLPLRWVLTRDPAGKRPVKALLCTDQALSPETIIRTFMHRWPIETTFEESRAHLGIETQRPWSDLAIERTTPLLLGLYSLVTLAGVQIAEQGPLFVEQTAWYRKSHATFHDVLACLRRQIWLAQSNQTSPVGLAVGLLAQTSLERLLYAACV